MYSISYMLQADLAWLPGTAVAGKGFVPGRRLPLVDARLSPPQGLIQHLCGMKAINQVIFLGPMVSTRPHGHDKCVLMDISVICIAQVCVIFKLPEHLGLYPHPLAYVEWFTSLRRRDPVSSQFVVTRSTWNHWRNVVVISADRFAHPCHLQAQCGKNISSDWTSGNVLEMATAFHVNLYINLDTFVALTD